MKANDFIVKNKDLLIIYVFALVMSLGLIVGRGVFTSPDTPSYISAYDTFVNGHLDSFRTPVYPFILGWMKFIFGENAFLFATIVFQHILFLLSIWFFYQVANELGVSRKANFWLTLFYGCFPYLNTWGNRIITESIAISLSVVLLYFFIILIQNKKTIAKMMWSGFGFFIILGLLLFHRPIFIYFLPVFLLIFGLKSMWRDGRKSAIVGLVASVLATICMLVYMSEFKQEYGVFATSRVSYQNNYANAHKEGLLKIEHPESGEFWSMTIAEQKEYTDSIFRADLSKTAEVVFHRFFRSADSQLLFYRGTGDHLWINMGWVYMFLLAYLCLFVWWMIRRKSIAWTSATMWILCVSNIIVAVVGADTEFNRLTLPSMPFVILMAGQLLALVKGKVVDMADFR